MKHFLLFALILASISCNVVKKKKKEKTIKTEIFIKTLKVTKKKKKEELIVVLKNSKNVENAKKLITNSGLYWEKLIFNQEALKIALIKVPSKKRAFWLKRLMKSGLFKSVELNGKMTVQNIKNEFNSNLISLIKTRCFGDCPVFEISINKKGKAIYNGIEYVLVKRKKEFQLTKKQFNMLKEKLSKVSFSTYKNVYNNPIISDLPSTYITYKMKQIQIRIWKNVPKPLIAVTEYLDKILLAKKFYE